VWELGIMKHDEEIILILQRTKNKRLNFSNELFLFTRKYDNLIVVNDVN